jgi:hypothetical protein
VAFEVADQRAGCADLVVAHPAAEAAEAAVPVGGRDRRSRGHVVAAERAARGGDRIGGGAGADGDDRGHGADGRGGAGQQSRLAPRREAVDGDPRGDRDERAQPCAKSGVRASTATATQADARTPTASTATPAHERRPQYSPASSPAPASTATAGAIALT